MKRAFAIAVVAELLFTVALLHSVIKDFLWTHPWWHSFLVALPTIALPILAYFELRHSSEANALQTEANVLQARIADLMAALDAERNKHLGDIARNTQRPITQAEKNAEILRRHLGANVAVSEGQGGWSATPQIVDVSEDIVTLFLPRSYLSSNASCVKVHCGELEIADIPQGSCPLRLKVLKRYGPDVPLGEITRWEDRHQSEAKPIFNRGGAAYHATYSKGGSSEARSLYVYASSDGANSFLLRASTGEEAIGNNEEISKRFLVLQVEYEAAGFARSGSGTGGGAHRLFIH